MIKRFAIEPSALRDWEDFRYVMEKMGFGQGRVVVAMPKAWIKQLLESLGNDVPEIKRKRFVEKLHRYKQDRIVRSGWEYDPSVLWVENAARAELKGLIEKVLVATASSADTTGCRYPTTADIDEDFFECCREIRCCSTAEALAHAARVFLEVSHFAIFVDPYFDIANNRYLEVLKEMVRHAVAGPRCRTFSIFAASERSPKTDGLKGMFDSVIGPAVTPGFAIETCFVAKTSRLDFHARYLLTSAGGLRYDRGFDVRQPNRIVDVSLLDSKLHAELLQVYTRENPDLEIDRSWAWRGCGPG
jgi:hypothetical protein